MKNNKLSFSQFLVLIGFAFLTTHCTGGTYVQPPEWGNSASPAANYSISGITDYGVESDGLIHLELQGDFSAFDDTIVAQCASTANPQVFVTNDAYDAVDFTLSPINDTCSFKVQGTYYGTNNSISQTVSATQMALSISYGYDSGTDSPGNGLDDIVLNGTFNGNNTDQVWAECDGATSFTQAVAASTPEDTTTQVAAAIPTPLNFYSCQFLVVGNGIQGLQYAALSITNASDLSTNTSTGNDTFELDGSFVGPASGLGGDQVWVACDGATVYTQILSSNIISDGYTKIQFLMPTPTDPTTCDFYIIGNGFQSATY